MGFRKQQSQGVDPVQDELRRLQKVRQLIRSQGQAAQSDLTDTAPDDTGTLKAAIAKASLDGTDEPEPWFGVGRYGANEANSLGDPATSWAGTLSAFFKDYRAGKFVETAIFPLRPKRKRKTP